MRPGSARAALLAGALAIAGGAAGAPEDWRLCPGDDWQLTGASDEEFALICKGVAAATSTLAACDVPTETVTRIRVVDELPLYCGVAVRGLFDPESDEIRLGNPAICLADAPEGSLFDRIAPSLAFVAIAAHEAAHAMLYAGGLGFERQLEHEYIAGVVQMSALPEAARAAFLEPLNIGANVPISHLNPIMYGMDPDRFIGLAWRHFEAEPDGCAVLRAMAEGTLRLEAFWPL
jgi:hypothetical protein